MKVPKAVPYVAAFLIILVLAGGFQLIRGSKNKIPAVPAEPVWLVYHEGVEKAKAENKYIMVNFYTDWCTFCKKLDKEVYTQEAVKRRLRNSYVAVKVNAESSKKVNFMGKEITSRELAKAFNVRGYPTIWFLDAQGEPVTAIPGFLEADKFAMVLDYISGSHYKTTEFADFAKKYTAK